MLQQAKEAKPSDPAVYMTLAGYYNRQGQFDKTIEALEERAAKEPNNPEAFYTIATYYWDEAYRDFKLKEAEKRDFVGKGVEAVDHALQIKPDYIEALVYKGLLLRLQANLEKDPAKQQQLIKDADGSATRRRSCARRRRPASARPNARNCRERPALQPVGSKAVRRMPDGLFVARPSQPRGKITGLRPIHFTRNSAAHEVIEKMSRTSLVAIGGAPGAASCCGPSAARTRKVSRRAPITGVVKDDQGAVIPGATVRRRAPALRHHLRSGDAGGRTIRHPRHEGRRSVQRSPRRFPGSRPKSKNNVSRAAWASTQDLDFALKVANVSETITVVGTERSGVQLGTHRRGHRGHARRARDAADDLRPHHRHHPPDAAVRRQRLDRRPGQPREQHDGRRLVLQQLVRPRRHHRRHRRPHRRRADLARGDRAGAGQRRAVRRAPGQLHRRRHQHRHAQRHQQDHRLGLPPHAQRVVRRRAKRPA